MGWGLVRLAVTVGLCAWIVWVVDWEAFWLVVRDSDPRLMGVVVLVLLLGTAISSYKWQRLLSVHGIRHPLLRLTRWYLTAGFFNQFLPTSVGGDAFRIYRTMGDRETRTDAVVAVLCERVTGLAGLLLVGLASAAWLFRSSGDRVALAFLLLVGAGTVVAAAATWLAARFRLLAFLERHERMPPILRGLAASVADLRRHPSELTLVLGISLLFHVFRVTGIWIALIAIGATTNYFELMVASAAVEVVGLVPISLGGLGVMEGSFIVVMGHFGLDPETALAGMLLMRVLLLPSHLLGASSYFLGDRGERVHRPVERPDLDPHRTPSWPMEQGDIS